MNPSQISQSQVTTILALVISTLVISLGHAIFHIVERALKPRHPQLAESVERIERTVFAPAPGFAAPPSPAAEDAKVTPITRPTDPTIPPAAASVLIFLLACCLGFHSSGCSERLTRGAITVANDMAKVETKVQPIVHDRCTVPMIALSKSPATEARDKAFEALATRCDTFEMGYDSFRKTHSELRAAIQDAESGGGITLEEMLQLIQQANAAVAAIGKSAADFEVSK